MTLLLIVIVNVLPFAGIVRFPLPRLIPHELRAFPTPDVAVIETLEPEFSP